MKKATVKDAAGCAGKALMLLICFAAALLCTVAADRYCPPEYSLVTAAAVGAVLTAACFAAARMLGLPLSHHPFGFRGAFVLYAVIPLAFLSAACYGPPGENADGTTAALTFAGMIFTVLWQNLLICGIGCGLLERKGGLPLASGLLLILLYAAVPLAQINSAAPQELICQAGVAVGTGGFLIVLYRHTKNILAPVLVCAAAGTVNIFFELYSPAPGSLGEHACIILKLLAALSFALGATVIFILRKKTYTQSAFSAVRDRS